MSYEYANIYDDSENTLEQLDSIKKGDNMTILNERYPEVLISREHFECITQKCEAESVKNSDIFEELIKILIPEENWSKSRTKFSYENKILASYGRTC